MSNLGTASNKAIARILRTWAKAEAAFADVLATQDPSWGSEQFALAGGHVVLCGPGMYVNHAFAVGVDAGLPEGEWQQFEDRCEAVGVRPAFEVSPVTAKETQDQLVSRGYEKDDTRAAFFFDLTDSQLPVEPDAAFLIQPANTELLALWQSTSAQGWGHSSPAARKTSDAYARAAAVVDGERLVLVRSTSDGRPIACASMTVRDRIATLGGMSTVPSERTRGVQAALIAHRLRVAAQLGCSLATATTAPGGSSERNLLRHGFERMCLLDTYVLRS